MDIKNLKKLSAKHNCLKLMEDENVVKFLKEVFNAAIDDCKDTFHMATNHKNGFLEEGEELNENHFEELKIK